MMYTKVEVSHNEGKKKGNCGSKSKSSTGDKKYYDCGNTGHFIKDCWEGKDKQNVREREMKQMLSFASNVDDGEVYVNASPVVNTVELNLTANFHLHE